MILYSLNNLKKTFDERTVLDIATMEIRSNRIYTLSGPNGAGKTTFLKILGFLTLPSAGHLSYMGRPVEFHEKYLSALRKSVILVHQHPILFSTSVYKNIEFGLKIRKIPRIQRKKIIESAIDLVGMTEFSHSDARHLSGGEIRRIAIARAIACSPAVLLLDEPTADLDIESRLTIETIIGEIHRKKPVTIIFCTHDLAQASRLTQHNIYFLNGQVNDFYHENIFTGDRIIAADGTHSCRIHEKLLIPIPATDKNKIKIAIHPDSIRMKVLKNKDFDGVAPWTGRVIHLGRDKEKIRAVIDIGIPVSAVMDKAEYELHQLRINDTVDIIFDRNGVTIL